MRFMLIGKATAESEAGVVPSPEESAAMQRYIEELVKAGVLLAAEGLHSSARGKRVTFSGREQTVIDGPFAETKELIAGFFLIEVRSLEEAVEWAKRSPVETGEVEIRQVFSEDDLAAMDPAHDESHVEMRRALESRRS